ncbi:MAG: TldD/PmbA family protein [Candidatus Odyssella sp.]|nr:TldD/PmbA family protein [Candidatus Odyssella sp.]
MDESASAGLEAARGVARQACAAGADAAQAVHVRETQVEVCFDMKRLTLLRTTEHDTISLDVFKGGRKGAATIAGRGDALAAGVAEALAAAAAAPSDPAHALAEAPALAPRVHGPAAADRDAMIGRALAHIAGVAREFPAVVSRESYHRFLCSRRSFANSAGLTQQETCGRYGFFTMFSARRDGRSTSLNYAGATAYRLFDDLMEAGALRRLYGEAERSLDPRPAPGKFVGDVVIAPGALGDFLWSLAGALGGYALMSGTSPYKDSKGARVASPLFSLLNRPTAAAFPEGRGFDAYGVPTRDLDVIRDGVLQDFLVDHYVARKLGLAQTAGVQNFVVPPGAASEAEIVAGTERGILLTRFSGGSPGASLDFSGIAKNSFYVEDGRIRHPLSETMISGNLRDLLLAIRAVSRETVDTGSARLPTIAAGGVTIHGRG